MPHPCPHPRPLAGLAHRCRCHRLLPQSRMRTARRRHCHSKDTIATTTIDQHRRTTAAASEELPRPPPSPLPSPLHLLQPLPPSLPSQPLSPSLSLPPPPPPPMPPPPHPPPCLRCHYCCSLRQRHCTSNAPVDGWLLCPLLLLACCVVRRPNLSAPPVMRSLMSTMTAIAAVNDCHRHCGQRRRPPKASGCRLSSSTAAMTIIANCSGGGWWRWR